MVHTANILTQEQYLQIVSEASVRSGNSSSDNITVDKPVIQSDLFNNVSPLYYKSKVRLSFSLSEEFKKHFVLIKGLIEFYRSKNFSFEYNAAQKGIETDVEVSELPNLQEFFDTVLNWLKEELKFKKALKVILDFEHRYKLEKAEVYSLFEKVASAR